MIVAKDLHMGGLKNEPFGLNFTLGQGQTHALVGANGIGKTTLLRMIAGQLPAEPKGALTVLGKTPFDLQYVMDRTVLMGIDNPLPEGWNVRRLFALGRARWSTWNQVRADELVERFELPNANYSGLSRGQKSVAGIIMAVASGCPIMLLDEPYLGLDAQRQQLFLEIMREEQGKRTIVVSTHHLDEVAGCLDTVLLLGPNPLSGPVDSLLESVLEITGPAQAVDSAISRLELPAIRREETSLGVKTLVDARNRDVDLIYSECAGQGLRVSEVTLENAVIALGGAPHV